MLGVLTITCRPEQWQAPSEDDTFAKSRLWWVLALSPSLFKASNEGGENQCCTPYCEHRNAYDILCSTGNTPPGMSPTLTPFRMLPTFRRPTDFQRTGQQHSRPLA